MTPAHQPSLDPPAAEFSRPVSTVRLGAEATVYRLTAGEAERAALARRFDLVSLDHFAATVRLTRRGRDISLAGEIAAEIVQLCGVTLEPFASRLTDHSTLLYRREAPQGDLAAEDEDYELLAGDTIDIGEAVAQQLSLALPPFPRAPGAVVPAAAPHPVAELAKSAKK